MSSTIDCRRCDEGLQLEKAPFRNELGEQIHKEICQDCWKDWLQHQTALINHYGLDPRDPKSREFLYGQIRNVLLGEGDPEDQKEIDTSKEGSIEW